MTAFIPTSAECVHAAIWIGKWILAFNALAFVALVVMSALDALETRRQIRFFHPPNNVVDFERRRQLSATLTRRRS